MSKTVLQILADTVHTLWPRLAFSMPTEAPITSLSSQNTPSKQHDTPQMDVDTTGHRLGGAESRPAVRKRSSSPADLRAPVDWKRVRDNDNAIEKAHFSRLKPPDPIRYKERVQSGSSAVISRPPTTWLPL